ncbi:glycosyltransferase family 2 protein [Thermoflexus sp.]|uniref:glycosyltransferase family 2 protein n=1 Tax=Thermoflexus sp. TaxID=1969742 RepID=UPI0035E428B1
MPAVSVVIPTWRGAARLTRCLEALSRQTFQDFEVIVVWNEGGRGGGIRVPAGMALRVETSETNIGFAAAVNWGMRLARGNYLAVLNDDAFPEPGWLEALVEGMEAGEGIGACASLMVFDHRPDIVQSAGIAMDRAAIAWDRWRGRPVVEVQTGGEVFGASAGAALYRRSMWEQLGGFDERFFAYLEDVELAWRAQIAGWRCIYVPGAVVRHQGSATLGEGSPRKKILLGRNKVWLVAKNAPGEDLPVILLYDLLAVIYAIAWRRDRYPLLGRLEGLRNLRPFLAQRRPGRPRLLEPLVPPWEVPKRFMYVM